MDTTIWWRVNAKVGATTSDWASAHFDRAQILAPSGLSPSEGTIVDQPAGLPAVLLGRRLRGHVLHVEIGPDQSFTDPAPREDLQHSGHGVLPERAPGRRHLLLAGERDAEPGHRHAFLGAALLRGQEPDSRHEPSVTGQRRHRSASEDVVLDWHPVPGATTYNLQVGTDRNFLNTPIVKGIVGTRYSPPKTLNNDQYFWRVTPVNADGVASDWQDEPWQFRRHWPEQPELEYPADNAVVGDPFFFQWAPAPLASRYELQLEHEPVVREPHDLQDRAHHAGFPRTATAGPERKAPTTGACSRTDDHTSATSVPVSEAINAEVHRFDLLPPRPWTCPRPPMAPRSPCPR